MDDFSIKVGERIKKLRAKSGMSCAELAYELGSMSGGQLVNSWEHGLWAPGSRWVLPLCKALQTTPEELLG